jgi:hypothetical protein
MWQRPINKCPQQNKALLLKVLAVHIDIPEATRLTKPIKSVPNLGLKPPLALDNIVLEYKRIALIPVISWMTIRMRATQDPDL